MVIERLISQIVVAGTGVGTNYCEVDCAESNKDFIHKMAIVNKEVKETKHYIRMLSRTCPGHASVGRKLWKEADEINRIFSSIIKKSKQREIEKVTIS